MRKVVGAQFKHLLIQFFGESLLLALIAFLFAVAITELALPFFELLVNSELTVPYTSPGSYIFSLLLILLVGLLGGLYPALVLSRFSPTQALKANQTTEADGSFKLRNVLVVFQFSASIALIIATVVAYFQLLYTSKHDPGFNPDNLLVVETSNSQNQKTLQQELLKVPSVSNIALSTLQPKLVGVGSFSGLDLRTKTDGSTPSQEFIIDEMFVDYNFFETYEISLLSGRYFTQGMDQEEPAPIFTIPPAPDYYKVKNHLD